MRKIIILFEVKTLGITITSDIMWNNQYIIDMDTDHVKNTIMWCDIRAQSVERTGLTNMKLYGFTYAEWVCIMQAELQRREKQEKEMAILLKQEEIQKEVEKTDPYAKLRRLQKEMEELVKK